jgi:hypothetical protein
MAKDDENGSEESSSESNTAAGKILDTPGDFAQTALDAIDGSGSRSSDDDSSDDDSDSDDSDSSKP